MAREGTKAHALSLASGEIPMASSAAIACVQQALSFVISAAAADADAAGAASRPLSIGLQFAVAEMEWWRSPWPSHPLLDGVMRRLPPAPAPAELAPAELAPAESVALDPIAAAAAAAAAEASGAEGPRAGAGAAPAGGGGGSAERVEAFLRGRLSAWDLSSPLSELGLDSLDLQQLRNAFQRAFGGSVPLSVFANAQQTLEALVQKLAPRA